jgi:hypothetical protein
MHAVVGAALRANEKDHVYSDFNEAYRDFISLKKIGHEDYKKYR